MSPQQVYGMIQTTKRKEGTFMPAKKETVKKETVKTEAEKKTVKKAAAKAAPKAAAKAAKTAVKAAEKTVKAAAPAKKATAKKAAPAKKAAKKPEVIIQSPLGGIITPDEILKKVGKVDKVYVRVDQNKAHWVHGDEVGSVDLWD